MAENVRCINKRAEYEWHDEEHDDCPIDGPHGHNMADPADVTYVPPASRNLSKGQFRG